MRKEANNHHHCNQKELQSRGCAVGADSADTDAVSEREEKRRERDSLIEMRPSEQRTAASLQIYHSRAEDLEAGTQMRNPLNRDGTKGMRDKNREDWRDSYHSPELSDNWRERRDVGEALKSTLCFDKGSPFIVDVKLFIIRVRIFITPHCRDASVRHHPVTPEAAASLQRG